MIKFTSLAELKGFLELCRKNGVDRVEVVGADAQKIFFEFGPQPKPQSAHRKHVTKKALEAASNLSATHPLDALREEDVLFYSSTQPGINYE